MTTFRDPLQPTPVHFSGMPKTTQPVKQQQVSFHSAELQENIKNIGLLDIQMTCEVLRNDNYPATSV